MARFDRYMLRQLLLAFGFFALVLVLVYWINRAVFLFDRLIANGESARVFLEFSMLTLPDMITIVLPFAAFAAAVFVTNRLNSESELVVAQSAGFGPFRIARPVLVFGLMTGAFMLLLNHVLVPKSQERLALRSAEVSENITARFLTEGAFVHPADGITFYIREINRNGELRDIFLSDVRDPAQHFIYSAKRALVVRSETGPKLVMFKGLAQVLNTGDDRLTTTSFEDFTFNLSALNDGDLLAPRSVKYMSTADLLRLSPEVLTDLNASPADFLLEAHSRTARAFLPLVGAMIGFSALMLGGFSRFGLWRQIVVSVGLLVTVFTLDNLGARVAASDDRLILLIYMPSIIGMMLVTSLLWLSPRLTLLPRKARILAPASSGATT